MKKWLFIIVTMVIIGSAAAQCPMCKTALKSNMEGKSNQKPVGKGINKAILFLMSMPYVLAGTAGVAYYYNRKKNKNNAPK